MKVAIDISPLQDGHKVRGIGYYLKNLKENLEKEKTEVELSFIENINTSSDASILHIPYFDPFFLTLPSNSKIPYIVTVHDLIPLVFSEHFPTGIKGKLKWQIQKGRVKKARAIITDSNSSKKDIGRIMGISSEKIHVIYLAASEKFKPFGESEKAKIRKKYNLPEKYVLYVGDATWNKNLVRLFKSLKNLGYPTYIIGKALNEENVSDNPWNKELLKAQDIIKESSNIHTLGFIPDEDLPVIYSAARVFAFPSLYEGFGLPVIEAMACGTPVVTTRNGSLQEVAGEAALFVDGNSENDIGKGIRSIYDNDDLYKKYSELGIQNAKKFSWEKTAEQTLDVYEQVLGVCSKIDHGINKKH